MLILHNDANVPALSYKIHRPLLGPSSHMQENEVVEGIAGQGSLEGYIIKCSLHVKNTKALATAKPAQHGILSLKDDSQLVV